MTAKFPSASGRAGQGGRDILGPFGHGNRLPHLQIFSDATTTLWGWPGSIINLLSYVLRAFCQKLRTVQEWDADKKCSFCWEGCLKISSPKTRKCHCTAQMDNSTHNTLKYPSSLVLRTCSEVPISLHTRNSICNVPKS
jgi:hypothetical protein